VLKAAVSWRKIAGAEFLLGRMNRKVAEIEDWLALARAAHYDVTKLAGVCDMSVRQLERLFLSADCGTPRNWLQHVRMLDAGSLLYEGLSIKVVALELGFKDLSHFYHVFKQFYNLAPSAFQMRLLSTDSIVYARNHSSPSYAVGGSSQKTGSKTSLSWQNPFANSAADALYAYIKRRL
jgi:AraC-like DNA-binding protein